MPRQFEQRLRMEAIKKHLTGKRKNAYIYGTLRKSGWRPGKKRKK